MKTCAVTSCANDSNRRPELCFFNLPRDSFSRDEWLDVLGLKRAEHIQNVKVCEEHFRPKDFCAGKKQLKTHALPVLKLGPGKTDPENSEDEFMHVSSDSDPEIVEVKKISIASTNISKVKTEIKQEPMDIKTDDESKETECETGRRPSRRAARVAAKKIHNTVCNYGIGAEEEEEDDVKPIIRSPPVIKLPIPAKLTPRIRPRMKEWHNIKSPPVRVDLVMECHEELLSAAQAEALLKAQLEYNMVMKTLRSLKANNVRIVCSTSDDPEPEKPESPKTIVSSLTVPPKVETSNEIKGKPNIITLTPINANGNLAVVPMQLSSSENAPTPIIG